MSSKEPVHLCVECLSIFPLSEIKENGGICPRCNNRQESLASFDNTSYSTPKSDALYKNPEEDPLAEFLQDEEEYEDPSSFFGVENPAPESTSDVAEVRIDVQSESEPSTDYLEEFLATREKEEVSESAAPVEDVSEPEEAPQTDEKAGETPETEAETEAPVIEKTATATPEEEVATKEETVQTSPPQEEEQESPAAREIPEEAVVKENITEITEQEATPQEEVRAKEDSASGASSIHQRNSDRLNQENTPKPIEKKKEGKSKAFIQALIAALILLGGVLIFQFLLKTKPEAEKVAITVDPPTVETITAKETTQALVIRSQGEVTPPKRTTLSAQVTGKVLSVSKRYEIGETFNEDEVIMTIEDIDYRTALINAKANKVQAQANLKEANVNLELEKAKVAQAKRDWEKLGQGKKASDLLLRKPQILAAEARADAANISIEQAQANIEQAQRDLDRTRIRAPYECQIERKEIDLGALVTVGMPLTTVYEKGRVEARLPISLEDLPFIKLPKGKRVTKVKAFAQYGNERKEWEGRLLRSENQIDAASRSAYVIVGFNGDSPPPVGLFIDVELEGASMKKVLAIPRIALVGDNQVIIVNEDETISFRDVNVERTSENMVFLSGGVKAGEQICTTVMNTPIAGTKVNVATEEE